jgi:hypothetical protein
MTNYRDPQDIARNEAPIVTPPREEPQGATSYIIPTAVLVLFLVGGILLAGSVPSNGPQVGQEIERPATPTTPTPPATTAPR